MRHTSYIELSQSALANNFNYLRQLVGKECQISHVVKGNAYGHGIESFVPLAVEQGARHFSTFDAHEAYRVQASTNGREVSIMIMGMIDNAQLEWAVDKGIEFYVFDIDRMEAATKAAKKVGKKARIHLELETGMNRTGLEKEYFPQAQKIIRTNQDYLSLRGFCTHYAGAEHYANFLRIHEQIDNFWSHVQEMKSVAIHADKLHTACSASTIRLPQTRMDMVRIGILQYGYWPSDETFITTVHSKTRQQEDPLKRVISWKSSIMSLKDVAMGEYIGYGTSYLASNDIQIAIVPVGYGYGFSRSLSNTGRVLVRNQRAQVIGTVNMNAIMIDVTRVEGIEKGDEVVLIGDQGDLNISVSSFGDYSEQLNYELLTRLPMEIPRKVVN